MGAALTMYADDNDGVLPYHSITLDTTPTYLNYPGAIGPYLKNANLLVCPQRRDLTYTSGEDSSPAYVYNRELNGFMMDAVGDPSNVLAVMDGVAISCALTGNEIFVDIEGTAYTEDPNEGGSPNRVIFARHNGGGNGQFLDSHAKWLKPENVREHLGTQALPRPRVAPPQAPLIPPQ